MTGSAIRVVFVLPDLHDGGSQSVALRLLGHLDRQRFAPALIVLERTGRLVDKVPADVRVVDCGKRQGEGWPAWFGRFVHGLRADPPDVVLSFLWFANCVSIVARPLVPFRVPLLVAERSSLAGSRDGFVTDRVRRLATRLLYPWADAAIANSERMKSELIGMAGVPAGRVHVVPNPVDVDAVRAAGRRGVGEGTRTSSDAEVPIVAGLGRLAPEKGFDLAIRALTLGGPRYRLRLIGEGPERGRLETLAKELGVSERLELTGFLDDPFPALEPAAVFILPSRWEGFPNALLEAMALGKPCIASACPTGPDEIITDGDDGLLVPTEDPPALAAAITRVLCDEVLRRRIEVGAGLRIEAFRTSAIVPRFEALIEGVVG